MSEYITNQIIMCKTSLERGRGPTIINVMSRRRMTEPKLKTRKALSITNMMSIINKWRPKDQLIEKDIA